METVFYYKTSSDTWVFSTGVKKDAYHAVEYKRMLEYSKRRVMRLFLNVPEQFEAIKANFYTPDYWRGRSWQDEYEERKRW